MWPSASYRAFQFPFVQTGDYPHFIGKEIEVWDHRANQWWGQNSSDGLGFGLITAERSTLELRGLKQPFHFVQDFVGQEFGKGSAVLLRPRNRTALVEDPLPRCLLHSQSRFSSPYGLSSPRAFSRGLGFLTTWWRKAVGLRYLVVGLPQNECLRERSETIIPTIACGFKQPQTASLDSREGM